MPDCSASATLSSLSETLDQRPSRVGGNVRDGEGMIFRPHIEPERTRSIVEIVSSRLRFQAVGSPPAITMTLRRSVGKFDRPVPEIPTLVSPASAPLP